MDEPTKYVLTELGLDRYIPTLEAEEIDWGAFVCLSDEDMEQMNIKLGARAKLRKYINEQLSTTAQTPAKVETEPSWGASISTGGQGNSNHSNSPDRNFQPTNGFHGEEGDLHRPWDKDYVPDEEGYEGPSGKSMYDTEQNVDRLFERHCNMGVNFDDYYNNLDVQPFGTQIPEPIQRFQQLALPQFLCNNIMKLKWQRPTPIQMYAIPALMVPRNVMGGAQTGSGKTGAFLIPIITAIDSRTGMPTDGPQALILAPTRELAQQLFEEARKLTHQCNIFTAVCFGGAPRSGQISQLLRKPQIVVGTPGRVTDFINSDFLVLSSIKHLVLDEADRLLDMGFGPDIRAIINHRAMPNRAERQLLLFSATMKQDVIDIARSLMNDEILYIIGRIDTAEKNVRQEVMQASTQQEKDAKLVDLLRNWVGSRVLVFCNTKLGCERIFRGLLRQGITAVTIHGDKTQAYRETSIKSFKTGQKMVMVATDVASRGLDIPNIALVINFDLPNTLDDYIHRVGRTGRCGNKGHAIAFYDSRTDRRIRESLVSCLREADCAVPGWMEGTADYGSKRGGYRKSGW